MHSLQGARVIYCCLERYHAEKEIVLTQEIGIFKVSYEHFTFLLSLIGLPLNMM